MQRTVFETMWAAVFYSGKIAVGKHHLPVLDHIDWNDCLKLDNDSISAPLRMELYRKQIEEKGLDVELDFVDDRVFVQADEEQISQVFVNILRNAVQALSVRPLAMLDADKQPIIAPDIIVLLNNTYSKKEIEISISDNGPGIPEEAQSSIFRPNFTTKSNGNGLGLAISKRIVEGTGGRITFESSDKGTTFYVYLKKKTR